MTMNGKIIAVCNHKGGVGKTTTTINVGMGLANRGKRVLLIDLDAQANLTDSLRITNTAIDIYKILKGAADAIPVTITPTLHIIPATLNLAGAENEFANEIGREKMLAEAIAPLRDQYDYIFIDTAPSLGLLAVNAFTAADELLIPIQAEYLALKGIAKLTEVFGSVRKRINPSLKIGGVIITQFDGRTILHRQIQTAIGKQFGSLLFETPVRNTITIAEAQVQGADIFAYAPDSAGAKDYSDICTEFLKRHNDIMA